VEEIVGQVDAEVVKRHSVLKKAFGVAGSLLRRTGFTHPINAFQFVCATFLFGSIVL